MINYEWKFYFIFKHLFVVILNADLEKAGKLYRQALEIMDTALKAVIGGTTSGENSDGPSEGGNEVY